MCVRRQKSGNASIEFSFIFSFDLDPPPEVGSRPGWVPAPKIIHKRRKKKSSRETKKNGATATPGIGTSRKESATVPAHEVSLSVCPSAILYQS